MAEVSYLGACYSTVGQIRMDEKKRQHESVYSVNYPYIERLKCHLLISIQTLFCLNHSSPDNLLYNAWVTCGVVPSVAVVIAKTHC